MNTTDRLSSTDPPSLSDFLRDTSEPKWVREMIDAYRRTGQFRPADLRRLLGDPTKHIEIGAKASLAKNLCQP